jgi:hypothetical protein
MKTTGVCLCDSPLRFEHGYCGRCWNRQFATDERAHGQPNPLSASAAPVPTAGAGRPSTPTPAASSPWETDPADDYAEAYNDADTARIGAIFEKRTGRP